MKRKASKTKNKAFTLRMPNDLAFRVDRFRKQIGATRTRLINVSIDEYLFKMRKLGWFLD